MTRLLDQVESPADLRGLTYSQLEQLAAEVREFLVDCVHGIGDGGHLASNLGVVELSLVLHRLFDTPRDKIVWDVSHQIYVHKILTGRKSEMNTIRQYMALRLRGPQRKPPRRLWRGPRRYLDLRRRWHGRRPRPHR